MLETVWATRAADINCPTLDQHMRPRAARLRNTSELHSLDPHSHANVRTHYPKHAIARTRRHAHTHADTDADTDADTCVQKHTHTLHTHARHTHMRRHRHRNRHRHTPTHAHTETHARTHTDTTVRTHTHTHTNTRTHTRACAALDSRRCWRNGGAGVAHRLAADSDKTTWGWSAPRIEPYASRALGGNHPIRRSTHMQGGVAPHSRLTGANETPTLRTIVIGSCGV